MPGGMTGWSALYQVGAIFAIGLTAKSLEDFYNNGPFSGIYVVD